MRLGTLPIHGGQQKGHEYDKPLAFEATRLRVFVFHQRLHPLRWRRAVPLHHPHLWHRRWPGNGAQKLPKLLRWNLLPWAATKTWGCRAPRRSPQRPLGIGELVQRAFECGPGNDPMKTDRQPDEHVLAQRNRRIMRASRRWEKHPV